MLNYFLLTSFLCRYTNQQIFIDWSGTKKTAWLSANGTFHLASQSPHEQRRVTPLCNYSSCTSRGHHSHRTRQTYRHTYIHTHTYMMQQQFLPVLVKGFLHYSHWRSCKWVFDSTTIVDAVRTYIRAYAPFVFTRFFHKNYYKIRETARILDSPYCLLRTCYYSVLTRT